jgi:hypothetical protein
LEDLLRWGFDRSTRPASAALALADDALPRLAMAPARVAPSLLACGLPAFWALHWLLGRVGRAATACTVASGKGAEVPAMQLVHLCADLIGWLEEVGVVMLHVASCILYLASPVAAWSFKFAKYGIIR